MSNRAGMRQSSSDNTVDPELVALPAPPRGARMVALGLMVLTVAGSAGLLAALVPDLQYFFSSSEPVALGRAVELEPATLPSNRFVTMLGSPRVASAVRLSRPLGPEYEVFPLAGQPAVFVRLPVVRGRVQAPGPSFSGRMVTFGQLGPRAAALRRYLRHELGLPVTTETYVVMAGVAPGADIWSLALAALCVLFIATNVFFAWRWFRPLRPLNAGRVPVVGPAT